MAMLNGSPNWPEGTFAKSTGYYNLSAHAKTPTKHYYGHVENATNCSASQCNLAQAANKGGIGNIDNILSDAPNNYWVCNTPNPTVRN